MAGTPTSLRVRSSHRAQSASAISYCSHFPCFINHSLIRLFSSQKNRRMWLRCFYLKGRKGKKKKERENKCAYSTLLFFFSDVDQKRKQVILNTQKLNNYLCSLRQCYHIRCIFSLRISDRDQWTWKSSPFPIAVSANGAELLWYRTPLRKKQMLCTPLET